MRLKKINAKVHWYGIYITCIECVKICLNYVVYFMSADWGSCTPSRRHGRTGELGGDRPSPVITLFNH